MASQTVLVVDDEHNIIELARLYLEQEGFTVEEARDGSEALDKIRTVKPAVVVLDLMLPEIDGWEVCRRTRAQSEVPIIMLTARSDDVDKIVGLELGADDYLTKPFNPRELVARVKAILRRYERSVQPGRIIHLGELTIDPSSREVTLVGQPVRLRAKEFDLLHTLAQHRGQVLSREQLLDLVWGYDYYGETRTVDVHIAHLRKRLSGGDVEIETVRGVGYKLAV
ncbi:MAG: response regulator [Anaerolineae bacterium]|nr:response regulator [Anaerolineae bacterium]NIN99044.1 response regulator [Anaerolineae bacterium]NIQ81892.1 response regulator [Anaerolineae bacterium]